MSFGEVEDHFTVSDGFEIFYRRWSAAGSIKRVLIGIHGGGGHSGVLRGITQDLAAEGAEVYAMDLRGFGNSVEKNLPRGDTKSFKRHLQDIDDIVGIIRKTHPDKKLFMFSHSFGGNIALWYAANHPDAVNGLILAAPVIAPAAKLPKADMIKFLFLYLFTPGRLYPLIEKTWPEEVKRKEEVKAIYADPLVTGEFSIRQLAGQKPLLDKALEYASKIQSPSLVIQGEADRVVLPEGAKKLLETLASNDKSLKMFPDADHFFYHAITSNPIPGRQKQLTGTMNAWLKTH